MCICAYIKHMQTLSLNYRSAPDCLLVVWSVLYCFTNPFSVFVGGLIAVNTYFTFLGDA